MREKFKKKKRVAGKRRSRISNVISLDLHYRMKCQSCGTEAPCPSCAVCGALLVTVLRDSPHGKVTMDELRKRVREVIHAWEHKHLDEADIRALKAALSKAQQESEER